MKSAVGRARHDSKQQQLEAEPDLARTKANRDVLTDADSDELLRVCAQNSDRLAAAFGSSSLWGVQLASEPAV